MQRHVVRARGLGSSVVLGALIALVALAATATAAFADGTVGRTGSQYVFQAGAGDHNQLSVYQDDSGISFHDSVTLTADPSATAAGCTQTDPNTVACDTTDQGITAIALNLGDLDDAQYPGGLTVGPARPLIIDGGAGDDDLTGALGPDTIHGGEGNDTIAGEPPSSNAGAGDALFGDAGRDAVRGGPGADAIDMGDGADTKAAGGPGNDTIVTGDGNDDDILGGPGDDSISTGEGNDSYVHGDCNGVCNAGEPGNDTIDLGAGDDYSADGDEGHDMILGGAGNDQALGGGDGDDTVDGGAGDDAIADDNICFACVGVFAPVADGNDVLRGGAGQDSIYDDSGSDILDGGPGDDYLHTHDGAIEPDTVKGGDGVDSLFYSYSCCDTTDLITFTLDDRADDGSKLHDGADNVASDVENVEIGGGNTNANLVGSSSANSLTGHNGEDTITGGAGADFLFGQAGDDTVNAQDGFPDGIDCGASLADVANVDQFDSVAHCETVNRVTLGSAYDDAGPTIAWAKPTDNARMRAGTNNPLEVTTSDDKGIAQVVFLAGTRIVCVDTAAPYACGYRPAGTDVGRTTLTAVANDTSRQSASALRNVVVGRFSATRLTARTSPAKDSTDPHRFTTTGRLRLPAGVSTRDGCDGVVAVTIKAGEKTLSDHRAALKGGCSYRSRVSFSIPSRLNPKTLSVRARFAGNRVLLPERAGLHKVKVAG